MTALAVLLFVLGYTATIQATEEVDGAAVYRMKCARCHGAMGEGSKRYSQRLEGDRSVRQLERVIFDTMPEEDPGSLTDAETTAVSQYIYDQFYSELARQRNRPARIDLSRLTVEQYRQSVSDLVESFRGQPNRTDERGLRAEYYRGRSPRRSRRVAERVDAKVDFAFGTESPIPDKLDAEEFNIRWRGLLLAPETGDYEIIVRSEHATQLWLNDSETPLINALVKSVNENEHKATIFLVAGRAYPLRLDFSKAKQGVNDKKKTDQQNASVRLCWRRPHQPDEVIPPRFLAPGNGPEVFNCSTPFPPDDRSYGWVRGTNISRAWDQATTNAAIETVGYVFAHLEELAGLGRKDDLAQRRAKLQTFGQHFAERAFRQPLTEPMRQVIHRQFVEFVKPEEALKRVLLWVLKSPRFLYRDLGNAPAAFAIAARLSFGLWDSLPDRQLWQAAAAGKLHKEQEVRRQIQRMLKDRRAKAKLRRFLFTWLKADQPHDLAKDATKYPGFDEQVIADLRNSLEWTLDALLTAEHADFRRLLHSEEVFVNQRLAEFYDLELPDPVDHSTFVPVAMNPGKRAGVLTHPYLMTMLAHHDATSPIHRGVFLARGVLGVALKPPPEAVAPLSPDLHPDLTTRERVTLQTSPANCMTCHGIINPLGYALEHFDAVGRFRLTDNAKQVDALGHYQPREGDRVEFRGARPMADFLAASPEVHAAFAEQLFHHLVQQPVRAYGSGTLEKLRHSFVTHDFDVRKLATEALVIAALRPEDLKVSTRRE